MNTEHQIKLKLAWPVCPKGYEIKTKMVQEQWLQVKMTFLLGYNLKVGMIKNLMGDFSSCGNEQIFG